MREARHITRNWITDVCVVTLLRVTLTVVTSGGTPTSGGDGADSMRLRRSQKVSPGSGERGRRLLWVVVYESYGL
jgi:hypothetical protein